MSWDKYVVGFVFGVAVGAAASSQGTPVVEIRREIQSEERYVPQVVPLQETHEVMPTHQAYNVEKHYSSN